MDSVGPILAGVRELGPVAAVVVACALGIVGSILLLRWSRDLLASDRTAGQATAFQDRLLKAVEALTASENALRARLDELMGENASLRDQADDMRETLALIRAQRRRLIGVLQKAIQEGVIAADAVPETELVGA